MNYEQEFQRQLELDGGRNYFSRRRNIYFHRVFSSSERVSAFIFFVKPNRLYFYVGREAHKTLMINPYKEFIFCSLLSTNLDLPILKTNGFLHEKSLIKNLIKHYLNKP